MLLFRQLFSEGSGFGVREGGLQQVTESTSVYVKLPMLVILAMVSDLRYDKSRAINLINLRQTLALQFDERRLKLISVSCAASFSLSRYRTCQ